MLFAEHTPRWRRTRHRFSAVWRQVTPVRLAIAGQDMRLRWGSLTRPRVGSFEVAAGDPRRPPKIPHLWPPQTPPPRGRRLST